MAIGNTIRIYQLMNPSLYIQNQDSLQQVMLGDMGKDEFEFNVSKNGFLTFFNTGKLWKKKPGGKLPASVQEVTAILTNYIWVECNARYQSLKQKPFLFPFASTSILNLTPSVVAVYNPKTRELDHLICRCYCKIYSNSQNDTLDIDGAVFEFRVGEDKKVIGFNIRWQPIVAPKQEIALAALENTGNSANAAGSTTNADSSSPPALVYVLDPVSQPFLSPYYKIMNEENANYKTASAYSLEISILQKDRSDGADLMVVVKGGSGQFLYNWAVWQPATLTTDGIRSVGGNRNILSVGRGAYNIILDVVDNRLRSQGIPVSKRHQQLIYAMGQKSGSNKADFPNT